MDKDKIHKEFLLKKEDYERLGKNLVEALKTFLRENGISYLDVYYRVKEINSFLKKIKRKEYSNPFEKIEDICGIRIICFYVSDIEKISKIIKNEFTILEEQDKAELLGLKEFAYRSKHYIVKINKSWTAAPNFRRLEEYKSEIQIRTILMHAWSEIEHKLNYKSDAQVPDKFQRKLYRLSAKLEEADEQFEELRFGIEEYVSKLNKTIEETKKFDIKQDFNIDSFNAFVKFYFPNDTSDPSMISISFEDFASHGKHFPELDSAIQKVKPYFEEISQDLSNLGYKSIIEYPSQLIAMALDIVDDETYNRRNDTTKPWRSVVNKWREKLK